MKLTVEKIGRSWFVMAGESRLGKFRSQGSANASMADDAALYAFWAGSAGVSIQNTPARVVSL